MTVSPRRTVTDVLTILEAHFAPFVDGFCGAKYVLWIGSGVSRDVVPGVSDLLKRVLEFVRSRIDSTDPNCPYRKALDEILDIGSVPATIQRTLDRRRPLTRGPTSQTSLDALRTSTPKSSMSKLVHMTLTIWCGRRWMLRRPTATQISSLTQSTSASRY